MGLTKPIEQKGNIKFYIKEVVSKRYYTRRIIMEQDRPNPYKHVAKWDH